MTDVSQWWFGWQEGVTGPRVALLDRENKDNDTAADEATKAAVVAWFNHAMGDSEATEADA